MTKMLVVGLMHAIPPTSAKHDRIPLTWAVAERTK